jgi:LysM repeat protein
VSKLRIPYHQLKYLSRKNHSVLSKETLYGIARYGVTVEDLNKLNPTLQKSGLKKGDKIRIPGTESNQNLAVFLWNQ